MEIYVVKQGDTLIQIAETYGVSVRRLAYDNELTGDMLVVGQALLILFPEILYVVEEGDTLFSISQRFETTVLEIVRNNSFLLNEDFLIPGRELVIQYRDVEERKIFVFGYAYSFIRELILREACLYLNELLPFSYGYRLDGSLIEMRDERLLDVATQFGMKKRMVLTPLDQNERFNNQLVIQLVTNKELQTVLIDNLIEQMKERGYDALDVDFEFIPGEYRREYVLFLQQVKLRFENLGFLLSVAVPPKISDDQPGLLYEGIDYQAIGEVADSVFLMTYEWGYKYGPPMAVAPIRSVRRVLDYAVSVIPNEKITMGIPNYAYDWPLPFVRDETVAETIGNWEAVNRAKQFGAEILFDETSMAPYFYYTKEGVEHVVWFEDVRSISKKYDLIKEYGFKGGGYWNLMREFRQNWLYLNQIHNPNES